MGDTEEVEPTLVYDQGDSLYRQIVGNKEAHKNQRHPTRILKRYGREICRLWIVITFGRGYTIYIKNRRTVVQCVFLHVSFNDFPCIRVPMDRLFVAIPFFSSLLNLFTSFLSLFSSYILFNSFYVQNSFYLVEIISSKIFNKSKPLRVEIFFMYFCFVKNLKGDFSNLVMSRQNN